MSSRARRPFIDPSPYDPAQAWQPTHDLPTWSATNGLRKTPATSEATTRIVHQPQLHLDIAQTEDASTQIVFEPN